MADDMGDLIAEQLSGEVVQEQPKELQKEVVDLTGGSEVQQETTEVKEESSEATQTPSEQPVESQDTNDRSLHSESNDQSQQSEVSEESPEEAQGRFLNFINDQFGTEFEDVSSFRDALTRKKSEFANEQLEKMNQFVSETGRTIADYIRTQTVDYSKMSNEDVMRIHMAQNNPELSRDEINVLIDSKYKLDKGKHSEADQTLGKIELKKDVSQARKDLMDMQEKYRMPVENNEASSEESESVRKEWVETMSNEVDEVESITFEMNENGEEFTFQLTDEHRQGLVDSNSDLNNYFDRYIDEDGNWDFDRLNTEMFVLNNFQDIIRSVANQYRSKGTEQVVKDIKNPSFDNTNKVATSKERSVLDELDDRMYGKGSIWNR
jgi:hypothetical protein|tara:strand:+ start:184 stop:1320 length:1137 start_codon:yes stop_codon:yes gene_type:complete